MMNVLKFGGTSLATPERMHEVLRLSREEEPAIVVLSAVSGTTNALQEIADRIRRGAEVDGALHALQTFYDTYIHDLLATEMARTRARRVVANQLEQVREQVALAATSSTGAHAWERSEKIIMAQGELMSTQLFQLMAAEQGQEVVLLSALDFIRLRSDQEPDLDQLRNRLELTLDAYSGESLFVTQGYICRDAMGHIDNLRRGGSDYTATLIGAAIQAREIQIWTDIDGLHNNDPRLVGHTRPVRRVSYREAAELAYFGAKILHPTCVIPAERAGIPLRLKNTLQPQAPGTLISATGSGQVIAALAAKSGITALRIQSDRMLNAYGFLRRVFEVFERHRTPVDMITTSEVSVSLTIDEVRALPVIIDELRQLGTVQVDSGQTILCLVGDQIQTSATVLSRVAEALSGIPLRMVSFGGSQNNVSILLPEEYAREALQRLHTVLFASAAAEQTCSKN